MIFQQVMSTMKPGATIPGTHYTVKGSGTRRGQDAFVYLIPDSRNSKQSEKGIAESEWEQAHDQLMQVGEFSRKWFNEAMPECAATEPCNFRAIGQTFVFLGMAGYRRGTYTRR